MTVSAQYGSVAVSDRFATIARSPLSSVLIHASTVKSSVPKSRVALSGTLPLSFPPSKRAAVFEPLTAGATPSTTPPL